jgi:hypothetical protein
MSRPTIITGDAKDIYVRRGGGVSRQSAQHDTITNKRVVRLRMPRAEEFIYYEPTAKGCAMG